MPSNRDKYLITKDEMLPGLSILLDTEAFIGLINDNLSIKSNIEANIKYIRYKPGTNCLILYNLIIDKKCYLVYAKGYEKDRLEKLKKSEIRKEVDTPLGSGRIIDFSKAIEVCFFPNDNKLKYLRKIVDKDSTAELLAKLFSKKKGVFKETTLDTIKYKPERRYVAKILNNNKVYGAVKFYNTKSYSVAFDNSGIIKSKGILKVPELLAYSDKYNILAFDWLDGFSLSDKIKDNDFDLNILRAVGEALSEIHNQRINANLPINQLNIYLYSLNSSLQSINFIYPEFTSRFEILKNKLFSFLEDNTSYLKPIHGDFYSKQVLILKDRIGILDFDRASIGDPAYDLGLFIAHLIRDHLRGFIDYDLIDLIKDELINGYNKNITKEFISRIDVFTILGLLSIAPHFFRNHEPNWDKNLENLIKACENISTRITSSHFYFKSEPDTINPGTI